MKNRTGSDLRASGREGSEQFNMDDLGPTADFSALEHNSPGSELAV